MIIPFYWFQLLIMIVNIQTTVLAAVFSGWISTGLTIGHIFTVVLQCFVFYALLRRRIGDLNLKFTPSIIKFVFLSVSLFILTFVRILVQFLDPSKGRDIASEILAWIDFAATVVSTPYLFVQFLKMIRNIAVKDPVKPERREKNS